MPNKLEAKNGVCIVSEHCDKCLCVECRLKGRSQSAIGTVCPFGYVHCLRCDKTAYVKDCVFRC